MIRNDRKKKKFLITNIRFLEFSQKKQSRISIDGENNPPTDQINYWWLLMLNSFFSQFLSSQIKQIMISKEKFIDYLSPIIRVFEGSMLWLEKESMTND